MGTSGDKIVLLDGMGSGSGSATNGLLSMIPGMFANLVGGNKMDPNLVAALMNGRNNQDGFGVAVVNPINVAVTGAAMVNNTERLVYFNKVRGVLRLMDCCVPTTAASASETDVDEE